MDAARRHADEYAARVRSLRSPALVSAFGRYTAWYVRRSFHALRIARDGLPDLAAGRPVLVYLNHPSWWDPLICLLLARRFFPGRAVFAPMNAATLGQYGFMKRLGVYGIEQGSATGTASFMFTATGLLADPRASVWITAEGRFVDSRARPVRLLPGVAHLALRVPDAVVLPLALDYTFWEERTPEALARFGPPLTGLTSLGTAAAIHRRLEEALTENMDALANLAVARDPAAFAPVMQGRAGVGGPYDAWRRLRAWSRGRRFDATHGGTGQDGTVRDRHEP